MIGNPLVENKVAELLFKYNVDNDGTHGIDHALKVAENALDIYRMEMLDKRMPFLDERITTMIYITSMFHDTYDHKYVSEDNVPKVKQEIRTFILNLPLPQMDFKFTLNDITEIFKIIDTMSYSVEAKGINYDGNDKHIFNIVQDADRMEAIGPIGLYRCLEYTKARNPQPSMMLDRDYKKIIDQSIIDHCNEKILFIYDKLKTISAKTLALKDHLFVVDYVKNNKTADDIYPINDDYFYDN